MKYNLNDPAYLEYLKNKLHDKFFNNANFDKAKIRYDHSIGVMNMAKRLAIIYNPNDEDFIRKAEIAGILHDYAKFLKEEDYNRLTKKYHIDFHYDQDYERVYHGFYGYLDVLDELEIDDKDILNAIKNHIMGAPDMTLLEKIIYVGDLIEMGRKETEIPILKPLRDLALSGKIDEAVAFESKHVIEHLIKCNNPVSVESLKTYNYYVKYLKGVNF